MFLYLKLRAINPSTLLVVLQLFSVGLLLPLEVFGDDESQIPLLLCCVQLLIGHVIIIIISYGSLLHRGRPRESIIYI